MRPVLMVVDDDPSVLLLVDVLAERLGFRVKAVTSGLHAPEQLRDGFHPDLILLDIKMERIDGVTLLAHLREMPGGADIPVIAMSTATVLELYQSQITVNDTLIKPITQQTLAAALQPYSPPLPDGE